MGFRCIWLMLIICGCMNGLTIIDSEPPSPSQKALMARYIIHNSDWISLSTVSTIKSIKSYPFANVKSMSDGPVSQSTGIPYILMTSLDLTGKDLDADNRCSLVATLAESDYCKNNDFDPQDPRCGRVILSGNFVKVNNLTDEYKFAQNALYSRHPAMKDWGEEHHFYIGKLNINLVLILDEFGPTQEIPLADYFNANLASRHNYL
ncbi:hypothetical protein FQR65_LT07317 [Abscondita terminalis]|nr:hypothetical protein FQR65_LT07317 [Abscondita terminalis]